MRAHLLPSLLLWISTVVLAQYGPDNEDKILPYDPPGQMPPMPPLDPPGYDPQLTNEPATSSQGPRPPPLPSWTHQIPHKDNDIVPEASGQQPKVVETTTTATTTLTSKDINGSGDDTDGSGSGSGDGEGSGSGDFFEGSGEGGGEDLNDIMKSMDREAVALGIHCPTDTIFVIDATSSVRGIFEEYITFLEKVIEGLDISPTVDHVGAIIYSSEKKQRMKIKLGEHKTMASLVNAVEALPFFSGITATGQALKFAANHTEGRRDNLILNYVILTDGYSYDLIESGARQLREVPNSKVYAVSIGEVFLKKELEMITGNPHNVLNNAMSYGTLVKRIKNCEARVKARFQHDSKSEHAVIYPGEFMADKKIPKNTITKTDAAVETNGNEESEVKKNSEQIPAKDCKYEVGIIFDSSGSLMQNFQSQLSFANRLVNQLPIAENQTRVGIVQFAGKTKTRVLASFKENKTKSQLKTIIDRSPFYSGTTFTNKALLRMAALFEESSRKDAKCKLVIFTDGYSAEDTSGGIEALKKLGVTIYTVGISTDKFTGLNMNELRGMATSPEHYFDSSDFSDLLKRFPSTEYCT